MQEKEINYITSQKKRKLLIEHIPIKQIGEVRVARLVRHRDIVPLVDSSNGEQLGSNPTSGPNHEQNELISLWYCSTVVSSTPSCPECLIGYQWLPRGYWLLED